jgi:hypothetical protein
MKINKLCVTANLSRNAVNYNIRGNNTNHSHCHEKNIDLNDIDSIFNKLFKDSIDKYNSKKKAFRPSYQNWRYYI